MKFFDRCTVHWKQMFKNDEKLCITSQSPKYDQNFISFFWVVIKFETLLFLIIRFSVLHAYSIVVMWADISILFESGHDFKRNSYRSIIKFYVAICMDKSFCTPHIHTHVMHPFYSIANLFHINMIDAQQTSTPLFQCREQKRIKL